jgi:hypothetical protein
VINKKALKIKISGLFDVKIGIKTKKLSLLTEFFLGALEWTRTPDPLIHSQG